VNHIGVLGYVHGLAGNLDQAKRLLSELRARAAEGYVSAMWIALVHLGLADRESFSTGWSVPSKNATAL